MERLQYTIPGPSAHRGVDFAPGALCALCVSEHGACFCLSPPQTCEALKVLDISNNLISERGVQVLALPYPRHAIRPAPPFHASSC